MQGKKKQETHGKVNQSHGHDDVYRLHIDRVPANKVHHTFAASKKMTHGAHAVAVAKHRPVWDFVWDKLQFLLVSLIVFVATYALINWQALALNAEHYWNVWRGFKSPLERLVTDTPAPVERLASGETDTRAKIKIPPLTMEVAPPDMRLVVPRINQNVPVVGVKNENLIARKWEDLEGDIQKALRNGVIHYPGTALPGENGNVVITGHSSYYVWDPGRFKDVFALLHDVRVKDKLVLYFNQKKYLYEVSGIKVVQPKDIEVLGSRSTGEQLTLITCTPIGTNLKRLVVTAKLIEVN